MNSSRSLMFIATIPSRTKVLSSLSSISDNLGVSVFREFICLGCKFFAILFPCPLLVLNTVNSYGLTWILPLLLLLPVHCHRSNASRVHLFQELSNHVSARKRAGRASKKRGPQSLCATCMPTRCLPRNSVFRDSEFEPNVRLHSFQTP